MAMFGQLGREQHQKFDLHARARPAANSWAKQFATDVLDDGLSFQQMIPDYFSLVSISFVDGFVGWCIYLARKLWTTLDFTARTLVADADSELAAEATCALDVMYR